jgi:hypothetical protein
VVAGNVEPPFLWTLGQLFGNVFVATAIHLLLAFPSGRLQTTVDRVLVGIAYVATTVLWLPFVLFTDPVDLGCAECPENLLLIDGNAAFVDAWLNGLSVIGVTVALAVVARLLQRWHEASAPLRRAVTPVFVAGAALMVALAALLAAGLLAPFGDSVTMSLFYACAVALGLVPYVFLAGLVRGRWIRGRGLGTLVRRLGQAPSAGGLRDELARALGDPSVELAYWLPSARQFVDATGRALPLPAPGERRSVTEVERDGRRIAAIIHDPALLDDAEQVSAAGAAAALALENERLEAELRANVEELSASRERSWSRATWLGGAWSAISTTALNSGWSHSPSACGCSVAGWRAIPTRSKSWTGLAASSTMLWKSCASSRAASIRRCSPIAASTQPWTAWPSARRCRSSSKPRRPTGCRIASSRRPTSSSPRR